MWRVISLHWAGSAVCLLGDGEPRRHLQQQIARAVFRDCIRRDARRQTVVKLRVPGRQQRLLRNDFDEQFPGGGEPVATDAEPQRLMGAHNLVVRSDHLKGGLGERRRVVRLAQYAGRPILVDPKGRDFSGYAGASMVTPNGSELQRIVDAWRSEEELAIRASALRALLGIASLLLTR